MNQSILMLQATMKREEMMRDAEQQRFANEISKVQSGTSLWQRVRLLIGSSTPRRQITNTRKNAPTQRRHTNPV